MALQDPNTTLGTLKAFAGVQQARAECYSQLHSGFHAMLTTRQEGPYLRLLQRSTALFQALSQDAVAAEDALRLEYAEPELADLIRGIQEGERDKLRFTLSLQALRQAHAFESFSWQRSDSEHAVLDAPLSGPDISTISLAQAASCGCQPGSSAPEASEHEWSQACAEATRGLQAAIEGINDAMEELRYARADLDGTES